MEIEEKIRCGLEKHLTSGLSVLNMVNKLILGLFSAGTVNLKEVCTRFKTGSYNTNYRAVQRFFRHEALDEVEVINFVVNQLFAETEAVTLAIDRTDWEFGQTRHNLLIVSVLYGKTAVPLVIKPLERKGNSGLRHRCEVMETVLKALPVYRIEAILGDREFIGDGWFSYLKSKNIPFVMRIRDNITAADDETCGAIRNIASKNKYDYHDKVHIGTQNLTLSAKQNGDDLIAVISDGVRDPLAFYKKRWGIETGFKCLKTNGFNLEDTHLKEAKRIKTLVQICSLTMTVALSVLPENQKQNAISSKKNTASKPFPSS
jgi:hypothetical protein